MQLSRVFLLATTLALASCAHDSVTEVRPRLLPPPGTGVLAGIETTIRKSLSVDEREPLTALGGYITALDESAQVLKQHPDDKLALRNYNFALARIFNVIREENLDPWTKPIAIPGSNYVLAHRRDPRAEWNPALWEFTPSDQLDISFSKMKERSVKPGIGAPLVARRKEIKSDARAEFLPDRLYYGVTAVATFEKDRCVISLLDPLAQENFRLNGTTYPLAADYTAPLALMLVQTDVKKLGLARMLRPGKYEQTARISRLEPYNPNKTVVLCIHGLMDSPATWAPLLNSLRADPEIRKDYQFWFYSYPSGYPYPYSAAILRDELDAIEKKFNMHGKMVVIGHSMGGCISRLLITDPGQYLWNGIFGKPPSEVKLMPETRKLLTESLLFKSRDEVGRVIFISAPLKGSDLATNWVGRLGSSLIKAPITLLQVSRDTLASTVTLQPTDLQLTRIPNSVDTLAPNNRFVRLINEVPIRKNTPYHTIMGDRGRGDAPNSSDGVVPYWSSHMENAVSEKIVPSDHGAHQNPQAIEEVRRILLSQFR